jgi:hypothetical protein
LTQTVAPHGTGARGGSSFPTHTGAGLAPARSGPTDGKEGGTVGPLTLLVRTDPARVAYEHKKSRTIQEGDNRSGS